MGKKTLIFLAAMLLIMGATTAMAEVGTGEVTAKSGDVDINIFGSLKTYPHFMNNADFNDDDTDFDWLLDESGYLDDDTVTVRTEARLGFAGKGKNWNFMAILEGDFVFDKNNTDRGARANEIDDDIGMTGEDFGIEKLEYTYDFSSHGAPMTLETGWNTKWLDIETGGLLYGDDHPYIGLKGTINDIAWEALSLFIYDDAGTVGLGDADQQDWEAYTLRFSFPVQDLKVMPFYAYSHNKAMDADVHYLGAQTFGKLGKLTPRAEFVYAYGDKDDYIGGDDADISAWAAFAALEVNVSEMINPYFGGQIITGDDNANDDDIEAYNPITNIARYTPTFGMENAFIYRLVPVLGSHLYSNDTTMLGANGGYGGISNSAKAESPGMYSMGLGTKGKEGKFSYKTQFQYFWFEETGALEDLEGISIDDEIGWEFDLQLTYHFTNHFSIGNVISIFDPGDGIEDLRGPDFDETAYLDTIELIWTF